MPAASSSRKRLTRRQRVASDIEEDESTQNKPEVKEDVGGKSRRVKKEKGAVGKRKRVEEEHSDGQHDEEQVEGDDGDENDARIDITNLSDQPLGRAELQKLKGLASDWQVMDKSIQQSWARVREVAVAMAEAAEGPEGEQSLEELDQLMRGLIDVSAEMNAHERTLDEIYQQVARGEQISDVMARYQNGVQSKNQGYSQQTTRQKYAKNDQYVRFKENIYEVLHPEQPMPPVTQLIPREDGDDEDDEDDLEIGGTTQVYKCPLSLTPLLDPLTSAVCGHSFSAEAIRGYFSGRELKKCPASGCNKSFMLSDCRPDKELARRVKAWVRRTQRNEEHSDAEEIVE
ncbi:hypothetical protein AX17_005007 [Amanita inopinata Kibby_2008]|nr:hypothetical protein AX17_005007 [Amanita inopinata Kibby_2008]